MKREGFKKAISGWKMNNVPKDIGSFCQHVGLVALAYVTHLLGLYHLSKIYSEKNRNM